MNDCSIKVGGKQCITTLDDYVSPLDIKEYEDLPHVTLTDGNDWDSYVLDKVVDEDDELFEVQTDLPPVIV